MSCHWSDDPGQEEFAQQPDCLFPGDLLGVEVGVFLEVFVEPLGGLDTSETVVVGPQLTAVSPPGKPGIKVADNA